MPKTTDGFEYADDSPLADVHEQISAMLQDAKTADGSVFYKWKFTPNSSVAGKQLLKGTDAEQVDVLTAALDQTVYYARPERINAVDRQLLNILGAAFMNWGNRGHDATEQHYRIIVGLKKLVSQLMKRNLPLQHDHVLRILVIMRASVIDNHQQSTIDLGTAIGAVERYTVEHGMSEEMKTIAKSVISVIQKDLVSNRKHRQRLEALIPGESKLLISPGAAWSDQAIQDLKEMPQEQQNAWAVFISHCMTATASKPTQKFINYSKELLEPIGEARFLELMTSWVPLTNKPRTIPLEVEHLWEVTDPMMFESTHEDIWKGLAWSFAAYDDSRLTKLLGDLADHMYYKIRGCGARSTRVGNACIAVLGLKSDPEAVVQLERMKAKVKKASMKKQIEKAIEKAAEARGLTTEDLAETSVPTLGFSEIGLFEQQFGELTAKMHVVNTRTIKTEFIKPDGKIQKTVPKALKDAFPEEMKELKANSKEAVKLLQIHRTRFEQSYLTDRAWTFADWQERFVQHPLLGWLVKGLIWEVDRGATEERFAMLDGKLVGADLQIVETPDRNDLVRLWHPIVSESSEIQAWREWLIQKQIQQPFKQAHREIYRITKAEAKNKTDSNDMAGHIVRQHQFAALCEDRGWRYSVQGAWDSYNVPCRQLPDHDLRAEFWVEPVTDETTPAGIFNYLETERVEFKRPSGDKPEALKDVPAVVFSEIMRDCDLFVGVASVGNDLNFESRRVLPRFTSYWRTFSFGDLNHSAQARHEILALILPQLAIADQCSLKDRFLSVEGEYRTYKIHLGSSNVLMEPDDEYLCIANKKRGKNPADDLQLPFEGDSTLSLILHKAFLLANDKAIKDEELLSQINP